MATLPAPQLTAHAKTRMSLSLHHLFAACRFATRITEVEQQNANAPFGEFWEEILHNALGVATMTVASLESYANELYFEGNAISPLLNAAAAAEFLALVDRESILRKYSVVLAIRTGKRLDSGNSHVQNVDALVKLRNAVVHFRPEWFEEQGEHEKLSKRLQHKFDPSHLLSAEPLFPRAWASHSFAQWALQSTITFLNYFYEEADLPNPLHPFTSHIQKLSGNAL
jgi:hypothetical protein